MATFTSVKALEKAILDRCELATDYATEWSKAMVEMHKQQFYDEYTPIDGGYIRTYQLRDSLDRTGVRSSGKGYEADVYFHNDWDYTDDPDDRGWTTAEIVNANMKGGHKQHNTAVWEDSIESLEGEWHDIAKGSLSLAGLPV